MSVFTRNPPATARNSSGVKLQEVDYVYDVYDQRIGKLVDTNGDGITDITERDVYIDGQKLNGLTSDHSPAAFPWDTNSVRDGPHELSARALDMEGNEGHSTNVAVWIENGGCGGCSSKNGGWEMLALVLLMAARARPRWLRWRSR